MAQALKDLMGPAAVGRLGDQLSDGEWAFERDVFVAAAIDGLEALELKARVAHVADALAGFLPRAYPDALEVIVGTLGPPVRGTDDVAEAFEVWPLCQFVEDRGLNEPELSLAAMRELTQRFSAEFAIRPYLVRHRDLTLGTIERWLDDPNVHVRRLCSEGTRPRLPWGQALRDFQADPTITLFVLDALVGDPERYVQRSVANHLNDHSRLHPGFVLASATRWLEHPSDARRWVIRHGLRTLVKGGHPGALELLGYGPPELSDVRLQVAPTSVAVGESVEIVLSLASAASADQALLIDYAVHYRRKNGSLGPKVFKWTERELVPGERLEIRKKQHFRNTSTRRLNPGEHAIEVQVNGRPVAREVLDVMPERASARS
jgi:3-methyladenine DNA glycosylase AlkC